MPVASAAKRVTPLKKAAHYFAQPNSDTHYFPFPLGPDRVEFVLNEECRLFTA